MFKCLFMKRKIFYLLEGSLCNADKEKVKLHIDSCPACKDKFDQMAVLLKSAVKKDQPQTDSAFWHDFQTGLDKKLNERLVPGMHLKPAFRLKPAFAYAGVVVFAVVMTMSVFFSSRFSAVKDSEAELMDEINFLYELSEEPVIIEDDDLFLIEGPNNPA